MFCPPAGFYAGKHGQDFRIANDHERNDGHAVLKGDLHEIVPPETGKLISVAIKRKRSFNTFRQYAQEFTGSKDTICILAAGEHAAELGDEVRDDRELQQTGMNQKTRDPTGIDRKSTRRNS